MKIQELKTQEIKKALGFDNASFRYHNKNKSGGNFGINFIFNSDNDKLREFYEISGEYNKEGIIMNLSIGKAYSHGSKVNIDNIKDLIDTFKSIVEAIRKEKLREKQEENSDSKINFQEEDNTSSLIQKNDVDPLEQELRNFTGTEHHFKNFTGIIYTDGIKYLAEKAEAYWLIDLVGSYLSKTKSIPFGLWELNKIEENKAIITFKEDTDSPILIKQEIPYTDFPLKEIKLYQCDGVLLLPGEY